MNPFGKAVRLNARKTLTKLLRESIKSSKGIQCDVCAVWVAERQGELLVHWETSHTNGVFGKKDPIELMIRKQAGQNLLTLAGIPKEKEDIPILYLLPFPSLIKFLGLKRYLKLIKQWPGKSMAMDIEVVQYRLY